MLITSTFILSSVNALDFDQSKMSFGKGLNETKKKERITCIAVLKLILGTYLSHGNPCFQSNIAIINFLVSNTCELRFHDVKGQSTVHMYSYAKNSKTWLTNMAK